MMPSTAKILREMKRSERPRSPCLNAESARIIRYQKSSGVFCLPGVDGHGGDVVNAGDGEKVEHAVTQRHEQHRQKEKHETRASLLKRE